jgi:hypothetical protein
MNFRAGALALALGTAVAGAQGNGPVVLRPQPTSLALTDEADRLDITIEEAGEISAFRLDIVYDPTVTLVTAVDAGDFLLSEQVEDGVGEGGAVGEVAVAGDPGRLTISAALVSQDGIWPEGDGTLAQVTFAPVGVGSSLVTLENVALQDATGQPVSTLPQSGQVVVAQPPPAAVQTQAAAQAAALTRPVAGAALPDVAAVTRDVTARVRAAGWTLGWILLLLLALLVVGVGWYLGRRPPEPTD